MAESVYVPGTLKEGYFADLPAPVAGDDARPITYNHATLSYVYSSAFATAAQVATHANLTNGAHGISAFGATLVDDADQATARTTLGLVIGTNVQAYDAELAAIAGLTSAADRLPYFTGSGTASLATFTALGRTVAGVADAAALRTAAALGTMATETAANYLLASGATTGASASAQTFTNGIKGDVVVPSDTSTAFSVWNAAKTLRIFTVNAATNRLALSDANGIFAEIKGSTSLLNTGVGVGTFNAITSGQSNVAMGPNAMLSTTSGSYNMALGVSALRLNQGGNFNAAVGYQCLYSNLGGTYNVAVGHNSLFSNTSGGSNMAVGASALFTNQGGSFNIAVGYQGLYSNLSGNYNVGIGHNALFANSASSNNVAIGASSLITNQSGSFNTAIGYQSLYSNVSGSSNVGIGYNAGYSETGSNVLHIANTNTKSLIKGDFSANTLAFGFTDLTTGTAAGDFSASTTARASMRLRNGTWPTTPNDGEFGNDGNAINIMVNGTNAVNTDGGIGVYMQSSTDDRPVGRLLWQYTTKTDATRATEGSLTAFYTSSEYKPIRWGANSGGLLLGLHGVAPTAISAAYTATNVITDRSYDANSTTLDEVADVLGTLIADLKTKGVIG